jgi:hypothetical protein
MGLFGKKPADEARKKLPPLEAQIAALRAEVEDLERQAKVAWGKRWSSTHMADRKRGPADGDKRTHGTPILGLDIRQQLLAGELKTKKQELETLVEEERRLREMIGG